MAYDPITDINGSAGLQEVFVYVSNQVPIFIPATLAGLFIIIAMGSYFSALRTRGRGDFPVSFTVAGFITTGTAFLMSLIPGLVNLPTIMIFLGITTLSALWLFTSRDR